MCDLDLRNVTLFQSHDKPLCTKKKSCERVKYKVAVKNGPDTMDLYSIWISLVILMLRMLDVGTSIGI